MDTAPSDTPPKQSPEGHSDSSTDTEHGGAQHISRNNSSVAQLRNHFLADVNTAHADILLLLCCLVSGLIDSTVYNAYGTFVSMQTGNTIFVGLGAFNQPSSKLYGWARSLTSIACFTLGSLFFSRLSRLLHPLHRITLTISFFLQTLFIFITAALVESGAVHGISMLSTPNIDWKEEIPIALLSFQSAGQIVGSRALGMSEVPTVVITSVLCDLVSDPELVSGVTRNAKRNRRALAFVGILTGAIAGGWISKSSGGMRAVLWLAGGFKLAITVAWALWPKKPKPKPALVI